MSIKIAAIAGRLFMGGITTDAERTAVAEAEQSQGVETKAQFNKKTDFDKDDTVFAVEEMASFYITAVGADNADPRAVAVFKAGQKAGRINAQGEYTGPSTSKDGDVDDEGSVAGLPKGTQTARDPGTGGNGCGANSCGGLTAVSRGRLGEEDMAPELEALEKALMEDDADEDIEDTRD